MARSRFNLRSAALSGAVTLLSAGLVASPAMAKPAPKAPAPAPAPASASASASALGIEVAAPMSAAQYAAATAACSAPTLSQPFLASGDTNLYTLGAGESADNFDGSGWTLSAGAKIASAQLADGATGSVLDLPGGAYAVSPLMCVNSDYPTARAMVEATSGAQAEAGVAYATVGTPTQLQFSGTLAGGAGWSLSSPLQLHPGSLAGWQLVQFILGNAGKKGDATVYDFYVDPRMAK